MVSRSASAIRLFVYGLFSCSLQHPLQATAHDLPSRPNIAYQWQAEQIERASSPYLPNYLDVNVMGGAGQIVNLEGKRCLQGDHFVFDVKDSYAYDLDEDIELTIEFGRETESAASSYVVVYDKNGGADGIVSMGIPAQTTAPLFSQTVILPRARFANRGDLHTDFLVAGGAVSRGFIGDKIVIAEKISICNITLNRSDPVPRQDAESGKLLLTILDEDGAQTATRLGIYDSSGRLVLPSSDAVEIWKFDELKNVFLLNEYTPWPGDNHYFYYADGQYEVSVPVGIYTVIASKGMGYRVFSKDIVVQQDTSSSVEIRLEQWDDLPAKGWYSGDLHVHALRLDDGDSSALVTQARANDLNVANVLQMGNIAITAFDQLGWGVGEGRYQQDDSVLVSGQEDPRTDVRGHTSHLNLQEPVRFPDRYLLYDEVFEAVAEQGGISGYAHAYGTGGGVIEGMALDVPSELVRFLEILQNGFMITNNWFDFLNLGYQLFPSAGSDYPYLKDFPGDVRNYVHIDGEFSVDSWFQNLAKGHTYVTNAPTIEFQLNDRSMGDEINMQAGEAISVHAITAVNPDFGVINRIELIEQGDVVSVVSSDATNELSLNYSSVSNHSSWFMIRVYGRNADDSAPIMAASSPIYVKVDGERTWKRDAVPEIVGRLNSLLGQLRARESIGYITDSWVTEEIWREQWGTQKELLNTQIDLAIEELNQLAARANSQQ